MRNFPTRWIVAVAVALCANQTRAAHDGSKAGAQGDDAGRPGIVSEVARTVSLTMSDAMRFDPANLQFARGDTVRLRITNTGKLAHEFVLGTQAQIDEHAAMMRKMPGMTHTDAGSVMVEPGGTAQIVWRFTRAGRFVYACLVPGHREAGMQGVVDVTERKR